MTKGTATPTLFELVGVRQAFPKPAGGELMVLDDVNMTVREGEIVGLLGRSGSGKSTTLRVVAGLIRPSSGIVRYQGELVRGPARGIAMVFQSFALFPWLTVLENVEAGLEALGVPSKEKRQRAEAAIELIGLDGFESAYPRELSGGMRQRVGFARALVVNPNLLLMDEPFSALDVLTAENLRTDLIELWSEGKLPIKSMILVTHGIEEAVLLCDRVLVFSTNPGRVRAEIPVPFKHPRNRLDPDFRKLVDDIYALMTQRSVLAAAPVSGQVGVLSGIADKLPQVSANLLAGLIETLAAAPYQGHVDLPVLSEDLQMEVDELFPIAEALHILRFADLAEGDIRLLPAAFAFAEADTDDRKALFGEHLLKYVPLVAHIRRVLEGRPRHRAPRLRFEPELEDQLSESYAEETLLAAISWGRYAVLYSYDDEAEMFSLEEEEVENEKAEQEGDGRRDAAE